MASLLADAHGEVEAASEAERVLADGLDEPDPLATITRDMLRELSDSDFEVYAGLLDEAREGRITHAEVVAFVERALDPYRGDDVNA